MPHVCDGEETQSKCIVCERDEYINVNLRLMWLPDNSALKHLTDLCEDRRESAYHTMTIDCLGASPII